MPYITKDRRRSILKEEKIVKTPGELNYIITMMIKEYLEGTPSYAKFNEVIGVLSCVQMEIYRRMVAPYEDKMAMKNGDVFS